MRFEFEEPFEEGTLLLIWKNLEIVDDAGTENRWLRLIERPASVPVPGACWFLGSGVVAFVAMRRYRRS